jgi:hypothetical protein
MAKHVFLHESRILPGVVGLPGSDAALTLQDFLRPFRIPLMRANRLRLVKLAEALQRIEIVVPLVFPFPSFATLKNFVDGVRGGE